ncbi:hypothetical protein [Chitinophaga japonensis]|uniref:Uncharacterized protein n=1 Tax=Chitinophaga japonensis TaxID=104662 RepID=A0A562T428_CHIJA|nr:hypothetical protein [Chitinophaga japonensis]TWI87816.1 hypothetical protein LX66_1887 [Chitinophaga japonensis]
MTNKCRNCKMNNHPISAFFHWRFCAEATNRKGKYFKGYYFNVIADSYPLARSLLDVQAKRKRLRLGKIRSVNVTGIAFAYYLTKGMPFVERDDYHHIQWPLIPAEH